VFDHHGRRSREIELECYWAQNVGIHNLYFLSFPHQDYHAGNFINVQGRSDMGAETLAVDISNNAFWGKFTSIAGQYIMENVQVHHNMAGCVGVGAAFVLYDTSAGPNKLDISDNYVDTNGICRADGSWGVYLRGANANANITHVNVSNNVATLTAALTAGYHIYPTYQITVSGLANSFLNGTWTVTSSDDVHIQFAVAHANIDANDSGALLQYSFAAANTTILRNEIQNIGNGNANLIDAALIQGSTIAQNDLENFGGANANYNLRFGGSDNSIGINNQCCSGFAPSVVKIDECDNCEVMPQKGASFIHVANSHNTTLHCPIEGNCSTVMQNDGGNANIRIYGQHGEYVTNFNFSNPVISGSGDLNAGAVSAQSVNTSSAAVAGDLTMRDIPGHAYFVSKYPSIQAAINAAYGSGTVSGEVIDDRTTAYSGPGFYVPDSVTVRLAPVPYSFTSAVSHNNGNNSVTAAIIVEQGAHLAGAGTSSNHGTTISVGSAFANDVIATSSVGTGTGAGVQWWHWGAIENLNVDGTNQAAGECVHVENMGETSRVRDLLVKNCYGNNIEFVGAAATQSEIANLSTSRSRNGSGVRFTNLSGLGKINGLSGDCNAGSLASVQENAAGTLVIVGLKSEAESTICSNGAAHDPVVLLDTLAGLNTHVHIVGGYAFGSAQNAIAKVVGSGGGIFEMEDFYSTGYTNLLNDTIRSVVVPATSASSKQPFYYEPNGIVFANQAFTLTPGTGVMGGSTSLTPIFYATTGNATMLAPIGNGDSQSIMTGGVQLAGQNRANYGATPELMARAGYRFTGSGYDTAKWDFVPAWNASDTTEKNLGNSLTVCQKNGSVSCRWNHVYGANVDALVFTLGTYTVATLPGSYGVGSLAWVNDGANGADCSSGHGSTRVLCYYTGSAWTALTTGGSAPTWGSITGTLANQTDLQTALNSKAASNASATVNGVNCALGSSCTPGVHLVNGTMIGPQTGIVGNGADQSVFSVTVPASTAVTGGGFKCYARFTKLSSSNSITFK
jgi:hypothetical protein